MLASAISRVTLFYAGGGQIILTVFPLHIDTVAAIMAGNACPITIIF